MEPAGDGEERQRLRQSRLSAVRARADDRLGVGQRSGDGDGPEREDGGDDADDRTDDIDGIT